MKYVHDSESQISPLLKDSLKDSLEVEVIEVDKRLQQELQEQQLKELKEEPLSTYIKLRKQVQDTGLNIQNHYKPEFLFQLKKKYHPIKIQLAAEHIAHAIISDVQVKNACSLIYHILNNIESANFGNLFHHLYERIK